jgi:hypothetical protein
MTYKQKFKDSSVYEQVIIGTVLGSYVNSPGTV